MIYLGLACAIIFAIVFLARYKKRAIKSAFAKGWTWVESSRMSQPEVAGNTVSFNLTGQAQYLPNFDRKKPYTRLNVQSSGVVHSVTGGEPTVNLFILCKGEDWQGAEFKRWWSKQSCGPNGSLAISLDPADWRSVSAAVTGDKYPDKFAAALKNIEGAGVTFGGAGGRGKGWTGPATVILTVS